MENSLKELKQNYLKLQKRYSMPSFKELNEEFDIEKAAEHETDCLIREIRKTIMDKVLAYLRFTEMLLNPSNAPMFFFALVKGMTGEEKRKIERIYEKLGNFEIEVIGLDCRYSEKDEAEFIKRIAKEWRDISEEMIKIMEVLKRNWNQKSRKNEREYCG